MNTLLAHLSDLHIREPGRLAYGRLDTSHYLRQAVQDLQQARQRPDAVLITGDLTDFGRAAEYAQLRALLAPLSQPIYLLPGNHDERQQLRASFPDMPWLGRDGFVQYSVPVGELQLIVLDTVVPGEPHGSLCEERLAWLAAELERQRQRPVLIAMHHPPFATLIGHMDAIGLRQGGPELEALLRQHPNVERVLCGHLHRSIQVRFGGTLAMTVPSPAHQVCLDLAPDAASAWTLEPPAYALHAWPEAGPLVSHLALCGRWPGPYPFHDGAGLID
ncbi:phosphodiesterase [Curvibacter sp. RS43]|uniref:Phosphodiesterase n=1 Tax=Curvibacter microcysteis TaxID=3026419 RepID=A0ABT5MJD6_9BURK|nr:MULTISPECIES: phosphodiesterase [unclassified Curvibacter]MDD0811878.1 phosphodiesterase [Curvibacter sp. RS43]MDD0816643.1 phosphodiesterase [Curvibacter sp. HBC28]